jgi:serine phosphatase RsbU (regulator of sigma subunit)
VGDCTGHGVPGALMTMTVNAVLYNIVTSISKDNPEIILKELNKLLKQALNKDLKSYATDDGLDIAICCIKNKSELLYAGANIDLHTKREQELIVCKGYKKGVGYNSTVLHDSLTNTVIPVKEGDIYILSSDGFIHQNGGYKDYPFGTKRFSDVIQNSSAPSMEVLKTEFEAALQEYMKDKPQRDDIVLLAFMLK